MYHMHFCDMSTKKILTSHDSLWFCGLFLELSSSTLHKFNNILANQLGKERGRNSFLSQSPKLTD